MPHYLSVRVALRYCCLVEPFKNFMTMWPVSFRAQTCPGGHFLTAQLHLLISNLLNVKKKLRNVISQTPTLGYFHVFRFYQAHPQQYLSLWKGSNVCLNAGGSVLFISSFTVRPSWRLLLHSLLCVRVHFKLVLPHRFNKSPENSHTQQSPPSPPHTHWSDH